MNPQGSGVSVIICAYTEQRWAELLQAVESVNRQEPPPAEIILVIDHNPPLLGRTRTCFPDLTVLENEHEPGLSGARNTGIAAARGEIIAFLDEDAIASPGWIAHLLEGYQDAAVLGVGGKIIPLWVVEKPGWFPEEFQWVVGCSYRGLPENPAPVRNLIGCNMSFRRIAFTNSQGFRLDIGRIGNRPLGCEETEFCIRLLGDNPGKQLLYLPSAQVDHRVPSPRRSFRYFLSRCYAEGLSKAQVARYVGAARGLSSERRYTLQTLPAGVLNGLRTAFAHRDPAGLGRAGAILAGFTATSAGYLLGGIFSRFTHYRALTSQASHPSGSLLAEPPASGFTPTLIRQVELSQPLPVITARDEPYNKEYRRLSLLVRLHGQPIGVLTLALEAAILPPAELASRIWESLWAKIITHLQADALPLIDQLTSTGLPLNGLPTCQVRKDTLLKNAPFVSVIVATRDRTPSLAQTMTSLLALDYPNFEILVVDNAPTTTATADYLRELSSISSRVRYVREDRSGLAIAHNRALQEVSAPLVAFTDDDVLVDPGWLRELVLEFLADENVACVTGLILPMQLETPSQAWIEQFGGFGKGFETRKVDLADHRPPHILFPYAAGSFGSGASMAFRTAVLSEMGGFDPALGAGTPALGGDDLAAFFSIITRGYSLVYQPAAILYHQHRPDYPGLKRQAYGYGVGLAAFLMKVLLERPQRLLQLAFRLPAGLAYLLSPTSPKNRHKSAAYPAELTRLELKGFLYGPLAYWRSHRRWSRLRRSSPVPGQSQLPLPTYPAAADKGMPL